MINRFSVSDQAMLDMAKFRLEKAKSALANSSTWYSIRSAKDDIDFETKRVEYWEQVKADSQP